MHFTLKPSLFILTLTCVTIMKLASAEISDECVGCICQASTGCNKDQRCSKAGLCGPFLISKEFWSDAGKPVIAGTQTLDEAAFKSCVTDLFCASETIRSYSKAFGKDCNGDGVIDCEDYVRIHYYGPNACDSQAFVESPFYREYSKCKAIVRPN